jgi:hypothetical protein
VTISQRTDSRQNIKEHFMKPISSESFAFTNVSINVSFKSSVITDRLPNHAYAYSPHPLHFPHKLQQTGNREREARNVFCVQKSNHRIHLAILAKDSDLAVASQKLQTHLLAIQIWLQKLRMQANALKSVHVTFTTRSGTCPPVRMNNVQLPYEDHIKYLGLHLDRKLTWLHHIFTKWKHLGVTLTKIYWLLGRKSQLSLATNYFCTKPSSNRSGLMVSNSGARLPHPTSRSWNASNRKALRMIVDAQWYVPNNLILRDLQIPSVKEEISHYSSHYCACLTAQPNDILLTLLEQPERKTLRHHLPNDLPTRFRV